MPANQAQNQWVERVLGFRWAAPQSDATQTANAAPDADAQAAELRALIQRIPSASAHGTPLFNTLLTLANAANKIPKENLAGKAEAIRKLREAFDGGGADDAKVEEQRRAEPSALEAALTAWREAGAEAGRQIEAVRKLLLATNDPALHGIAKSGLDGMIGTPFAELETALRDVAEASAAERPKLAALAVSAVGGLRRFLESDKRIAACDACPTVPISLRNTYGSGLDRLEPVLNGAG